MDGFGFRASSTLGTFDAEKARNLPTSPSNSGLIPASIFQSSTPQRTLETRMSRSLITTLTSRQIFRRAYFQHRRSSFAEDWGHYFWHSFTARIFGWPIPCAPKHEPLSERTQEQACRPITYLLEASCPGGSVSRGSPASLFAQRGEFIFRVF